MMAINLKRTFIASDHHFGSYSHFWPFMTFTKDEENVLIDKWNQVVQSNDTVIYNGDFHDCGLADLIDYRKRLNGHIILVKGNHDFFQDEIYEAIFDEVYDELKLDDLEIVIRHIPQEDSKVKQIYGHLHHGIPNPLDPTMNYCSCIQFHNGYPICLNDIIEQLR